MSQTARSLVAHGACAVALALLMSSVTNAAENVRSGERVVLPADVTPDHYRIEITPNAAALTFTGTVRVDITVHAPTRSIVLNSADIVIDRAALAGGPAVSAITYQKGPQTATFRLAGALAPGSYTLQLAYHGKIFQQASGLFALDYQTGTIAARALFTQFENSDARRFVPCWDEPAQKATFELTATVPTAEMALSNMPVASTENHGSTKTVHFAATPKMSSYLLFFGERTHAQLTQTHFAIDPASTSATLWHVPVTTRLGDDYQTTLIAGGDAQGIEGTGCGALILNAGQSSYFRSRYTPQEFSRLAEHYGSLTPEDQLGLLHDTSALALAGGEPMANLLELVRQVPADADPLVVLDLVRTLEGMNRLFDGLPMQAAFRSYAIAVLTPALTRIGWTPKARETDNVALLRAALIEALSALEDPSVVAEGRSRFVDYLRDPSATPADTRRTVLQIVALHADAQAWMQLETLAEQAKTELERRELYTLLGTAEDPALAHRALDLAFSGKPPATVTPEIISAVSRLHPDMAFDYATSHWDRLASYIEPASQPEYIPHLLSRAYDPVLIGKLDAFAGQHIPPSARQNVRNMKSNIRYNAAIRSERLPEVVAWIEHRSPRA